MAALLMPGVTPYGGGTAMDGAEPANDRRRDAGHAPNLLGQIGLAWTDLAEYDSAWAAARRLDVLEEFARQPYHAGIFFYPRSVGGLDPDKADWIVFLYAAGRRSVR